MNKNFNSIASGQPPLTFFDKLFSENFSDVLYTSLNEIEPIFLENPHIQANEFSQPQRVDPRNKLPIKQPLQDHTVLPKPKLFQSANGSLLTKKEHSICLAFLQSLKAKSQICPKQLFCFDKTSEKRQKEKTKFLQFLLQYNNANYEKIYSPDRMFFDLYQKFYKWQSKLLMEKHKDGIFQIHTGFPMPQSCGSPEMHGKVSDVKVVVSRAIRFVNLQADLSKMRRGIETYFESYACGKIEESEMEQSTQFQISTEALVFLLCAGDYIDIPTEVLVKVVRRDDGESVVEINETLPSRTTGIHTSELVVSKCAEVFLELKETKFEEIQATGFCGPYFLETINNFMSKCGCARPVNRNLNIVKWNLSLDNGERQISILTQVKQPYGLAQTRSPICQSLKLEYKPQFGCEVLSKAALLREWIEQRMSASTDAVTDRHRINASTFDTILHENLSLEDIEQELQRHFNVSMPRLLGSLGDFLNLLIKISTGRYLLRYNPRFKDKLILYGETEDASSKTCVRLHALLQETPSDMDFMTSRQLIPIDESLCSAVHEIHQVLPCAFPHWVGRVKTKIIDDRKFILQKIKAKADIKTAKEAQIKQRRNKVKYLKKQQKLKLKSLQKKQEQTNAKEMEDDINKDRLFYGFAEP